MNVLLVGDFRRLREALEQAIKNSGYSVQSEENGSDALRTINSIQIMFTVSFHHFQNVWTKHQQSNDHGSDRRDQYGSGGYVF